MKNKRNYFFCPICHQIFSCNLQCQVKKRIICICSDCLKKEAIDLGLTVDVAEDIVKELKGICKIRRAKSEKEAALLRLRMELEGIKVFKRKRV
ncbi:MAG: hypothetical protein DRJ03_17160 [Chloroflexi bacterium]|nr:MAG: hypothetical protein DRJ03_17160 [Chloroflexota bacterium]